MAGIKRLVDYTPTKFMLPTSHYEKRAADHAVDFIEDLPHTIGEWEGMPFKLMDWQERIIRDVFGVLKPNGFRQFKYVYVEIPKKNGKSELAAAIALKLLCGDFEAAAQVYGCAADINQAAIVYDVAKRMVELHPELSKTIKIRESRKRLEFKPRNSFYQVLSSEAFTKHGLNVHGCVFDELHAQPNRRLYDTMTSGSGDSRKQPLYFIITTAGDNKTSIGYEVHQYALDVLKGVRYDPSFYPMVFGAAEDADWTDPKVWIEANPSLGTTFEFDAIEEFYNKAKGNPTRENIFRQLRLNQWVASAHRWMPMAEWSKCSDPVDAEALVGRECYAGMDLASTQDLASLALTFPPQDETEKYMVLLFFWLPEDNLKTYAEKHNVNYAKWVQDKLIITTPGNVIDYSYIHNMIVNVLAKKYRIKEIATDLWNSRHLTQELERDGITCIEFRQGIKSFSPPMKDLMRLVLSRQIAHGGNEVLDWQMDNMVVKSDVNENTMPVKKDGNKIFKIDGPVSVIMSLDRAVLQDDDEPKVYDGSRLMFV